MLVVCALALSTLLIGLALLQRGGTGGSLAVVPSASAVSPSQDSDEDGLADWEELAYGSSPTRADTDGDGTLDGQEIAEGRDPSIKGPNDQKSSLPTTDEVFALGASAREGNENLTESLSRELFTTLVAAKESGYSEIPSVQEEIVARALAQVEVAPEARSYTLEDLTVLPSSGKADLLAYARAVGVAVIAHQSVGFAFTTLAFGKALEGGDPLALDLLSRYRATYHSLSSALLAIASPGAVSPLHLSLINNTEKIVASFADMTQVLGDPVRGFAGYKNYQQALAENGGTLMTLARQFKESGILFSTEGGESFWREIPASP